MSAANTLLMTSMLISAIDRAAAVSAKLKAAQAEGRDVTDAEVLEAVAADDKAKADLDAAIAAARNAGA